MPLHAQQSQYDDINYSKGTFFGGATNDSYLLHVAVDKAGNIYGTGFGRDIPITPNAYQSTRKGPYDIVVFKLDPTMSRLIWSTYIGGSQYEAAGSIAVNDAGEVFLAGYTLSPDFPVSTQADSNFLANGTVNIFALKLSNDGTQLLYSHILGNGSSITQQTEGASKGAQLAIDPANNVYVLSQTNSSNYYITTNAFQRTIGGARDLVLSKIDPQGNLVYGTYIGGTADDLAGEIIFARGMLYCTGSTASTNFPVGAGKTPDAQDAFVMSIDVLPLPAPTKAWIFGGSGLDRGISLCYDAHSDRLCMTGSSASADFPSRASLQTGQSTGGFIASYDRSLTRCDFITVLGVGIVPTSIVARQSNSSVFISGYASSTIPVTSNAFAKTLRGGLDGVMFSVDSSGIGLRYGTYIGGSNQDYSTAKVLLFEQGCALRVIFGITTHSPNFPTSADAYQPLKLNGTEDQPALVLFSQLQTDPKVTSTTKPCSGEVKFNLQVPCPPLGVIWNFGDGGEDVGFGPVKHSYTHNGSFTVKITLVYPEPDTMVLQRTVTVYAVADSVRVQHNVYACAKDPKIQLAAFNCQQYRWSPGSELSDSTVPNPIVKTMKNGTYYVRGWDANGCESFDSVMVYIIKFKAAVDSSVRICKGSSVTLHAAGGSMYSWYPPTGLNKTDKSIVVASPQESTTYRVIVTDGSCPDTANVTVTVENPPRVSTGTDVTLCPNATAQLEARVEGDTTGFRYQWLPSYGLSDTHIANPRVQLDQSMRYFVIVTSPLGCVARDSIMVRVQNSIKATICPDQRVCEQGNVRLSAGGGSSYRWEPSIDLDNAGSAQPLCSPRQDRRYTVYVMSGTCIDSQFVTVRVDAAPTVRAVDSGPTCEGDPAILRVAQPQAGVRYHWSPDSAFVNNDSAEVIARPHSDAVYVVTATNTFGCIGRDTAYHHVQNALRVTACADTSMCLGGTAELHFQTDGDAVQWYPPIGVVDSARHAYVVQPMQTTRFILRAQRGGCIGYDTVDVLIGTAPEIQMTHQQAVCAGQTTTVSARSTMSDVQYHWFPTSLVDHPDSASVTTVPVFEPTTLYCLATQHGCETLDSIHISLHQRMSVLGSADAWICPTEAVTMSVQCDGMRAVQWSPMNGLSSGTATTVMASPDLTTRYTVVVQDSNGCIDSTHVTVNVRRRHSYNFTLNSVNSIPGTFVDLIVKGSSDTDVVSDLALDLQLNRTIFLTVDGTVTTNNELQTIALAVPSQHFGPTPIEVARVHGMMLSTDTPVSEIVLTRADLDASSCPQTHVKPGLIEIQSCSSSLRKFSLVSPLRVSLLHHPVESKAYVELAREAGAMVHCEVYSAHGEFALAQDVFQSASIQRVELDLQVLTAGHYVLRVSDGISVEFLPFIKVE